MERPTQCKTCAYHGRFADAPAEIQWHHGEYIGQCRSEDDNNVYMGHRCHTDHEYNCAGCARWTREMDAAPSPSPLPPTEKEPD